MNAALPSVLIINDSTVARAVTAAVVQAAGDFRLLGQASTGTQGVDMVRRLKPDLVLLDMHMPDINGVEVTRRIMAERPTRILICSATVRRNTTFIFDALKLGALDYTHTPSLSAAPGARIDAEALRKAGANLLRKMRTLHKLPSGARTGIGQDVEAPRPRRAAPSKVTGAHLKMVAIGSSTGGPTALANLFKCLPTGLNLAYLISQHIDEAFTPGLALWLSQETGHPVEVAQAGTRPEPGHAYLASGGRSNLILTTAATLRYEPSGEALYYPNIDRLFSTVSACLGKRACGVVLTGLGDDGSRGLDELKLAGGRALAQDPATAVVDGMPGSCIRRGVVSHGQPLDELARLIAHWANT